MLENLVTDNFFNSLGFEEKQSIRDRINVLVDMTEHWASSYSSIRPVRVPTVALHTAVTAPRISLDAVFSVVKMSFWEFGVDDIADEQGVPLSELQKKTEQWYLIANEGLSDTRENRSELSKMLLEIREDLLGFDLFEPLQKHWAFEVRSFAETMVREYQYGVQYAKSSHGALPSLDEYLRSGSRSIGVPLWATTVWIVANDSSIQDCLELMTEAVLLAGVSIRLYNDLKTFDREKQEQTINSVIIMQSDFLNQAPGMPERHALDKAKRYVLQLADSYAQQCYNLVKQIRTDSGQAENAISQTVAFHNYFYGRSHHEYNTTSLGEIKEMLS